MEPIQTPTNEALDLQIQALKGRITMLEREVDYHRDISRLEHDRCIKWATIQDQSIDRLWLMYFIVAASIILHSAGHMLINWSK